jgi:hypothetical protein
VVVYAREQRGVPPDVVTLLADRRRRAHHHVVGLREVDVGVAVGQCPDPDRGQIVGTHGLERPLARAPDRRSDGVDDHGFWHLVGLLVSGADTGDRPRPTERPPAGLPGVIATAAADPGPAAMYNARNRPCRGGLSGHKHPAHAYVPKTVALAVISGLVQVRATRRLG